MPKAVRGCRWLQSPVRIHYRVGLEEILDFVAIRRGRAGERSKASRALIRAAES
jgi:hypothetical protein